MARSLLKTTAILFLTIHFLLAFCSRTVLAEIDLEEDEVYVLDDPIPDHSSSRGRFLATIVKKGARCAPRKLRQEFHSRKNICNGVTANKGSSLLFCCKKHCRDVLSDKNNCGRCGRKCNYGHRCCNGKCLNVLTHDRNCGKCGRRCAPKVRCKVGICGYA